MSNSLAHLHDNLARVGRRVFPRRLYVGLAAVLVAAFLVDPEDLFGPYRRAGMIGSLGLVIAGLMGRAWAAGYAGGHTRSGSIEAPRLATAGPYAYVRNPIYLASIILGLGMIGLLSDARLLVLHAGVFAFLYITVVPAEERFLRQQFGAKYEEYCRHVRRFLPRLTPWRREKPPVFNWKATLGELRIALILIGIYAFLRTAGELRGVA